jgi:truncated hemoglobin YjbI
MAETLYGAIGGASGCRRLAEAFYARVGADTLLRPLFPGKTLHCAIEEFAAFLIQFLGGPAEDSQRRWWVSLRESHARFRIGSGHREAWMSLMVQALDDAEIVEPARTALREFFGESSAYLVNQGERPRIVKARGELADRWQAQLELDEAAAAIREAGQFVGRVPTPASGPQTGSPRKTGHFRFL